MVFVKGAIFFAFYLPDDCSIRCMLNSLDRVTLKNKCWVIKLRNKKKFEGDNFNTYLKVLGMDLLKPHCILTCSSQKISKNIF